MRVLITGGAGFIGSHLADTLIARGDDVVIFDNLSTGSLQNIGGVVRSRRGTLIVGDVCDRAALERASEGCDAIYHLAAAVGVQLILAQPIASMQTNLTGVANVLDVASARGTPVLFTSSSEVYGNAADARLLRESDARTYGSTATFRWTYAGAKAMGESMALAYHKERTLPVVVVRLFNVSGPRQSGSYGMVLPRFVRQALACEPVTVYGDGNQSRAFAHVQDIVDSLPQLLGNHTAHGHVFNLGSDNSLSMNRLAEIVIERTGSTSPIVHVPYAEAYPPGFEEIRKRHPDISRARRVVGFAPTRDITSIIEGIVSWERQSAREAA